MTQGREGMTSNEEKYNINSATKDRTNGFFGGPLLYIKKKKTLASLI
jgi:hypothetical protein